MGSSAIFVPSVAGRRRRKSRPLWSGHGCAFWRGPILFFSPRIKKEVWLLGIYFFERNIYCVACVRWQLLGGVAGCVGNIGLSTQSPKIWEGERGQTKNLPMLVFAAAFF
ncbi:hypothetical protein TW95_gp1669 [Pandoravirus inopinatum]|uniref:Uncharacterized protein n=1 Tax=Pandoravirus inopinatum TaxID=1605721 RepID=A0A0B5IZP2_9VIRU|nr:hypothetical protein TW95_gp1669 [Pandoravirus inopinatum]AJF98403.1 hypothetical protein [Pandoravirus inopinatum]